MSARPIIDQEVPVTDELARLRPRSCEPEPIDDVIETALEQLKEDLARDPLLAVGSLEVAPELAFQHAVHPLDPLLLAQLQSVPD